MPQMKFWKAINMALMSEMDRDPDIILAGVDTGTAGGVFGVSRNLQKKFGPWRVRDTPISENSIVGLGVGAAANGLRPVVEIMYLDFTMLAMDQIVNQAAKYSYFSGGDSLPMVILTSHGGGGPHGAQHSQSIEGWFCAVPGLTVVMPSDSSDAYGLMKAAIRSDSPVLYVSSLQLLSRLSDAPAADHIVELGKARIRRSGSDVTIVTYGRMTHVVLEAAEQLFSEHGISAEVVDLRTLSPLDKYSILTSLKRTNKLIVVQEAMMPVSIGSEIAAIAVSEGFDSLDAPVIRVTSPFVNVPVSGQLSALRAPDTQTVVDAAVSLVQDGR